MVKTAAINHLKEQPMPSLWRRREDAKPRYSPRSPFSRDDRPRDWKGTGELPRARVLSQLRLCAADHGPGFLVALHDVYSHSKVSQPAEIPGNGLGEPQYQSGKDQQNRTA